MKKLTLLLLLVLSFGFAQAQYIDFTEVTPQQTFLERQDFEDSYNPEFRDFDNDGDMDVIYLNESDSTIILAENDGNGNYSTINTVEAPLNLSLKLPFLTDANNDGHLDISLIGKSNNDYIIYIYLNDGANAFSTTPIQTVLFHDSGIYRKFIFNDMDDDGIEDVLPSGFYYGHFYSNDGSGHYIRNNNINFGNYELKLFDYNNDGRLDVLTTGDQQLVIKCYINGGNGQYASPSTIDLQVYGERILSFEIADLNNDGNNDFIVLVQSSLNGQYIRTFINSGTDFLPQQNFAKGTSAIKIIDINNDGYLDVFRMAENFGIVYINDGSGNFSDDDTSFLLPGLLDSATFKISVVDINNDGQKDLYYKNALGGVMLNINQKFVHTGVVGLHVLKESYLTKRCMQLEDVDCDGIKDLIMINETIDASNSQNSISCTNVYKGTSSGFEVVPFMQVDKMKGSDCKFADFNNDGYVDYILLHIISSIDNDGHLVLTEDNNIYINDGLGHFTAHSFSFGVVFGAEILDVHDFNNDGYNDILLFRGSEFGSSSRDLESRIYLNDATGNISNNIFSLTLQIQNVGYGYGGVIDINSDGNLDVLQDNTLYTNDGNGNFTASTFNTHGKFIDFDGDGDKDIVNGNRLFENDGTGNFTDIGTDMGSYNIPISSSIETYIADFNNDGLDDIARTMQDPNTSRQLFGNIGNHKFIKNVTSVNSSDLPPRYYRGIIHCLGDVNGDNYIDLILPSESNPDFYSVFINDSAAGGSMRAQMDEYKQVRIDDYPTYDMSTVSLSNNFTSLALTNFGYYNNFTDAENQVNQLPNIITNRTDGPIDVVGRFETNRGQYVNIIFKLGIMPDFYVYHPVIPDIGNDGTETINLTDSFGITTFYYTEADALGNQNSMTGSITIDSTGRTVWMRATLDGQTVTSPIHFSLGPDIFSYDINRIPYSLYQINATPATVMSDRYSDIIPTGFDFDYFGNNYHNIVIGDNGIVSFNVNNANEHCDWRFYASSNHTNDILQKNAIYGVFQDLDNRNGIGSIGYGEIGTAPFRKFVAFYDSIPLFQNQNITATSQVVLYETYNFIDVQVKHREPNNAWLNGNGVIGIRNVFGNKSYYPPNRYIGNWTADNEAWRFRPIQTFPHYQYILCDANNDGVETFSTSYILNHFNTGGAGVTYSLHLSEDEANTNTNPITGNFQNTTNAQTVFVRIDDNGTVTIKRVLLAAIDCTADYDIDSVPTTAEDINGNGNYGDDDTDGDGIPDFMDDDDDGDMILTNIEIITSRSNTNINYSDTDGDGIPNYLDNDDDGDGVLTINEDYDGDGNPLNDDVNNDGIPDYLQQSVTNGVVQLSNKELVLYPNPTKNNVNIKFAKNMHNIMVTVLSFDGRELSHNYYTQANQLIVTLPNEKGIYFVKVSSNEGVALRKIIKE